MKNSFFLSAALAAAVATAAFAEGDSTAVADTLAPVPAGAAGPTSESQLAAAQSGALEAEFPGGGASFDEDVRQAFAAAMNDVAASLRDSGIPAGARVAALPVTGDAGRGVYGMLKNAITASGHVCVEDGGDPIWKVILAEAKFDNRNAGLLDPETLVKIGNLQTVDVVVYGAVRQCSKDENRVYVELELHATDRATKRHVWGGLFAKRWYVPGADIPKGISELPLATRQQLKDDVTGKLVESLKAQAKLKDVRSVVITPLVGDEDRYCTYIARDAIVKTDLVAKELDIDSLRGARVVFRDVPVADGDAVVYGAVRQLGWFSETIDPFGVCHRITVALDFQAAIERNDTHDVVWSDTVQSYDEFYDVRWERAVVPGIALLVALVFLGVVLKSATRVR